VPHKYRKFRKMGGTFWDRPQPTSKYVRWRFQCHCTWYKVRVCTEVSFSRNIVGGLGCPKSEKFTRRSRARHLQNGADGKLFDRRPSYCAVVLRMTRPTSDKNLGFEKSKMAELRSIEFLTCGRISMRHAYPFVTSVGDRRTAHSCE
jgi:hypothetical protein